MAIVYKAKDVVLNRNVAVKVLRDEFTTDNEFIRRFETEAQSAARLTHPNIVSIYDVGVDNGIYYIVMELIQGKTLKEIIVEENGPLPWKWSVNVAMQIAAALDMAHKNNIIHRDIKPHNIIITEDGVAKVTDFGIAKAVSNSTITAFGTTIGSVHYFSPEHARGGFTDAKSDIYSLGVVMYEMLTGRVPFDADTPVSVALKHMQEEPVPPIELNLNIPEVVNKIILKALKKDPMERYQTSMELLQDLKEALKNPNGDFVEDNYDATARTQKISLDDYENMRGKETNQNKKDENKFIKWIKEHKKLSAILGLILLFFIAFAGTMVVLNITNPKEVDLPNVVGLTKEEAQKQIEDAKLKFEVDKEEYNKDVEENHVISQDPTYFEKYHSVKQGSTVKVVISKGTEKATVPKVVGMKQDDAVKALEDANLKAEVVEETSKKVQAGYVISQDVDENTEVSAGDSVKIHVSKGTGIKQLTMVNVVGQDADSAKSTLEGMGLKVNITYATSTADNGKVSKQSVAEGKTVDEGTTVTLTVNKVAENKTITISVNVKAITGGYTETTEKADNKTDNTAATTTNVSKTVNIKVNGETRTGVSKNESNCTVSLNGKDGQSETVTVTITDPNSGSTIYSSSQPATFGTTNTLTFTK
mgnify:FL=1